MQRLLSMGVSANTPSFSENVPPLALATAIGDKDLYDMIKAVSGVLLLCISLSAVCVTAGLFHM